ncbi:GTPase HflX [Algimonas ampicilliniresistens]|uniref:GTPase HflX n=1 Tax=Algimonas ampicilliniresistens TaxID=1298735 RepID=A0ABQ5V7V6_9PROT|nr:GTPase HflX [Algimonas ampicilliniresistens]GLQ23626.1 GTPase HflX [Algimonas ampicilliniresistens]
MYDLEVKIERALVVHPRFTDARSGDADYDLEEAVGLAEALGVAPVEARIVPIRDVKVSNFFGSGQIEDMAASIQALALNVVIVNGELTPIQQRNLEKALNVKVIDRTGLILEIFGLRAATKEGRLQVELARLNYERSRLVRTWTHLERQRGGSGFLSGPGETQIESDRRQLNDKIDKLKSQLDDVRRTRDLQRAKRRRSDERIVALVGYTNAGKSTLFNRVTTGGVFAQDMLFATLDTTHRILPLPSGQSAIISDTVGFISDLPTQLITSFRATLEETLEADVLLHVRDISDPLTSRRREEVMDVLNQIGAGPDHGQALIEVWNKADLLPASERENIESLAERARTEASLTDAFVVSCLSGAGIGDLLEGVEEALTRSDEILDVTITPDVFSARAWLHENGHVINEAPGDAGAVAMTVRLTESDAGKFRARFSELMN